MMRFGNEAAADDSAAGTIHHVPASPPSRPGSLGMIALVAAAALVLGVLSFYQTTSAQTNNPAQQPFANSVQQRFDMVELQNELLRSGQLRVVVSQGNP